MRAFIAIDIPEEIRSYLTECQKKIGFAKLSKVGINNMHLTLKFLGEVPEDKLIVVKSHFPPVYFTGGF